MNKLKKQMSMIIAICVCMGIFTTVSGYENMDGKQETLTSTMPGYSENGQDINECSLYTDVCPEGYSCINLPGSYICEAMPGFEGETPDPNPGGSIIIPPKSHSILAICVGPTPLCAAICTNCMTLYASYALGIPTKIIGICTCNNTIFKPFIKNDQ